MRRRVLLLDVMGTLVRDPFYDAMPAFFGMTMAELLASKHPAAWVEFERGRIDEAAMLRSFFVDGRAVDGPGLVQAMRRGYAWLPVVQALLQQLARAGVEMHALSNYPPWFRMIEAQLGLSRWVGWTFVSCVTGLRKPDAAAYRHALAGLGASPSHAIFVDDRAENCEAARRCGIDTVHFVDAAGLGAALVSRGWLGRR